MEKVVAFVLAREAEGFAGATAVEKGRPMKQFVTEESFWELFPEAQIGIVVAHNMKPTEEVAPEDAAAIARALAEANGKADQHLESNTISQNEWWPYGATLPEVQDEEGSALFHREPAEARAEGQSRGLHHAVGGHLQHGVAYARAARGR